MAVHLIWLWCYKVKHCECLPCFDSRRRGLPCHTEMAGGNRGIFPHCCSFLAHPFCALVGQSWVDLPNLGHWVGGHTIPVLCICKPRFRCGKLSVLTLTVSLGRDLEDVQWKCEICSNSWDLCHHERGIRKEDEEISSSFVRSQVLHLQGMDDYFCVGIHLQDMDDYFCVGSL